MKKNACACLRMLVVLSLSLVGARLARADLVVNEASYSGGKHPDENGKKPDWIELYNSDSNAVDIGGCWLTDSGAGSSSPTPTEGSVVLPSYFLPAYSYLVIFADGTDTVTWTDAPNVEAIPPNSEWKFYTGSSGPVSTWTNLLFNDTTWSNGVSPIGYNDATLNMDCATPLLFNTPANRYPAAYFRKKFSFQHQGTMTGLLVNARLTDGAVLYLNDTEVHRVNMPAGAVSHTTAALSDTAPTQWHTFTLPTNHLAAGVNTLAVSVHRAAHAGVDLIFDLSLTALVSGQMPFIHAPFSLKADPAEKIHLYDKNGSRLHKFNDNNTVVAEGASLGLATDGAIVDGAEVAYRIPTPGLPNHTYDNAVTETLTPQAPSFSYAPGFYVTSPTVSISSSADGHYIKYTLDGSDPLTSDTAARVYAPATVGIASAAQVTSGLSWIRTNPVELANRMPEAVWRAPVGSVTKAVVLRAVAVSANGLECSPERRGTYFVGNEFANRALPVVSLITDQDNLFGFTSGLYIPGKHYADSPNGYGSNKWGKPYANYHQPNDGQAWERVTHMELFELGASSAALAQVAGMAMHGGGTRAIPQKTLYFLARGAEYGTSHFNYTLFPDMPTTTSYKRFLLRNSGNDWYGPDRIDNVGTMMKDAVLQHIVGGLDLSMQAYRPVSVYINGEYWGIHNMRESFDKHYLTTRYGLDADNMDILMHEEASGGKVKISRIDGDKNANNDYETLLNWIDAAQISDNAKFRELEQWIDVTNHTDYIIAETFFANTDWPINNCDFWRAHTNQTATCGKYGDGRWRWMLYDLDLAGEKGADYNMFAYLSTSAMTGKSEPGFIINQLWQNEAYRAYFVDRYATLLNTTFQPARTVPIIEAAAAAIAPEIEQHFRRWGRSTTQAQWQSAVQSVLIDFVETRHTESWKHLAAKFNRGTPRTLTVRNANPTGAGGHFVVNNIVIDSGTDGVTNRAAWTGTFFDDAAVTVTTMPDAGYVFDGWVGTAITNPAPVLHFVGGAPITLTARFRLSGAAAYQPSLYEKWAESNYNETVILATATARPDSASGIGSFSNYALFALGVNCFDPNALELARSRVRINIENRANNMWVTHFRTPAPYTLLSATSLVNDTWQPHVPAQTVTNDTLIEHKTSPSEPVRFFKWHIPQP